MRLIVPVVIVIITVVALLKQGGAIAPFFSRTFKGGDIGPRQSAPDCKLIGFCDEIGDKLMAEVIKMSIVAPEDQLSSLA